MEHQLRRGICRPNARHLTLSVSLAPLVAHRSLIFRVETDLGTKASYADLTSAEESPALYTLSGSPQIVSAVLTAVSAAIPTTMSSASMYSQDSWNAASPSIPLVEADSTTRQMANAFSPTVELSDIAEGDGDEEFTTKSIPPDSIPIPKVNGVDNTESRFTPGVTPSLANNAVRESIRSLLDVGSPSTLGKRFSMIKSKSKKIDQQNSKGSKASKAIRKVVARLSFLPSERESVHLQRATSPHCS